jgi:hypothetical protein
MITFYDQKRIFCLRAGKMMTSPGFWGIIFGDIKLEGRDSHGILL